MGFIYKISILLLLFSANPGVVSGQDTSSTTTSTVNTSLDPSPFTTTRAAGMGGALSTVADDLDALYYNPAGIGRLGFEGKSDKTPFFRELAFPYAAGSLNENASSVQKQFGATSAQSDASAGAAVMDANAGKRQYARVSFLPIGLLMGRMALVPIVDHQIAAVPVVNDPGKVEMRYRTYSGAMVGTSVADNANRFALGVSQTFGTIEETYGTFNYIDMVDVDKRKELLKQNRKSYQAKALNAGMTIRIPKSITPTLSIVARNLGNTKNETKDPANEPLIYDEDLTAGFSISPEIGNFGRFNMIIEGSHLTQKHMEGKKKLRGGIELLLGGDNSKSLLGIRAGGNDAGASMGVHLNLGLIGIEAETHAVDVGTDNERLIERRSSAAVFINVASF